MPFRDYKLIAAVIGFSASIEPWHVLTAVLTSVVALGATLWRVIISAGTFRKSVLDELKVTRVSIRELLTDLANRNPEAMGKIVAAMNDQSVSDFVRGESKKQ